MQTSERIVRCMCALSTCTHGPSGGAWKVKILYESTIRPHSFAFQLHTLYIAAKAVAPCRQHGVTSQADRLTAGIISGGSWPGKGKGRCSCALCCCSRMTGLGSPVRACCPETSTPTSMGIAYTRSRRSAHRCSRLFAPKHQHRGRNCVHIARRQRHGWAYLLQHR